jgi:cytochrome o ubiquinol oxidase operon protein cyoD
MSLREHTTGRDHRTYLTGFVLALILTLIPFAVVYWALLSATATLVVIVVTAIAQIVIQLRFFLHINFKTTPRENLIALFFAAFLIFVMVGGSLWILFDLHHRHAIAP